MKRAVRVFAVLMLAALAVEFGNSCAYAPDQDVFIQHTDPDAPYARYAGGRLGIVQATFRIRHLVVAFNTLSGRGLSPAEQSGAIAVDNHYNAYPAPEPDGGVTPSTEPPAGAASATLPHWPAGPDDNDRKVPGQDWESFTNCLADSFRNANATLADRRARYGKPGAPDTPEIADWIAGQQAVFTNCSGAGQAPQPAPANAPLWLRKDRAYQTAAAQFYALDYDQALAGFPITLPWQRPESASSWHLYVVQTPARARRAVFEGMRARGVGVQVLYIPVHRQPYYEALGFRAGDYPVAEEYYSRSFTLPIFPGLTDDEQGIVIESLAETLKDAGVGDSAE